MTTTSLNAAFGSIDITPEHKTTLGCNGHHTSTYQRIDSIIEINGIRLEQDNKRIVMLSVDTLYVPEDIKHDILYRVNKTHQLKSDDFFWGASHTHYAPLLDQSKPAIGRVDTTYREEVIQKASSLLTELLSKPTEKVSLHTQTIPLDNIAINRRNVAWGFHKKCVLSKRMRIFPNKNAFIDKNARLIHIKTPDSTTRAVIWSMACHPVQYHSPKNVTSHFPGYIRKKIRQQTHPKLPILFFQGFSGDVRPLHTPEPQNLRDRFLKILNNENSFKDFSKNDYSNWLNSIEAQIIPKLASNHEIAPLQIDLHHKKETIPLTALLDTSDKRLINIHAIFLNKNTVMLGVSAEMLSDYAKIIQNTFPDKTIIPMNCIGDVFGYWPTDKQVSEGGYESNDFLKNFNLKGAFKTGLEKQFLSVLKKLIPN